MVEKSEKAGSEERATGKKVEAKTEKPKKPKTTRRSTSSSKGSSSKARSSPRAKAKTTAHKTKRTKHTKRSRVVLARGKRKEAIARASIKENKNSKGRFIINGKSVDTFQNEYLRQLLLEPLEIIGVDPSNVDIKIKVSGGGVMGQIQAIRRAISVGLVEYLRDEKLWDRLYETDKYLVVEDSRRVEPKKYKGRKARARFQKSYR